MSVASIQIIKNIRKHPNADTLNIGTVLGWQVIFNHTQNNYQDGDKVIYIEIDSVVPEKPEFEFLRTKHFRVRPIRLRGEASNGLCMPLNILPEGDYQVGQDVTDLLGASHYEKPLPASLSGKSIGYLPGFLIKTDELNLRSFPDALNELRGREYYITRKDDGSSGSFFLKNNTFGVCSRNLQLARDETNTFWKMADQYKIEEVLKNYYLGQNIAIQGEVVGPGIQDNHLGLSQVEFHIFNVFFIDDRTYGTFSQLRDFSNSAAIPMVTLIEMGDKFNLSIESLLRLANGLKYPNGTPAEGIVIRPQWPLRSLVMQKEWSGKILNENYKDSE